MGNWDPLGTLPEHFIAHAAMGVVSGGAGLAATMFTRGTVFPDPTDTDYQPAIFIHDRPGVGDWIYFNLRDGSGTWDWRPIGGMGAFP